MLPKKETLEKKKKTERSLEGKKKGLKGKGLGVASTEKNRVAKGSFIQELRHLYELRYTKAKE